MFSSLRFCGIGQEQILALTFDFDLVKTPHHNSPHKLSKPQASTH